MLIIILFGFPSTDLMLQATEYERRRRLQTPAQRILEEDAVVAREQLARQRAAVAEKPVQHHEAENAAGGQREPIGRDAQREVGKMSRNQRHQDRPPNDPMQHSRRMIKQYSAKYDEFRGRHDELDIKERNGTLNAREVAIERQRIINKQNELLDRIRQHEQKIQAFDAKMSEQRQIEAGTRTQAATREVMPMKPADELMPAIRIEREQPGLYAGPAIGKRTPLLAPNDGPGYHAINPADAAPGRAAQIAEGAAAGARAVGGAVGRGARAVGRGAVFTGKAVYRGGAAITRKLVRVGQMGQNLSPQAKVGIAVAGYQAGSIIGEGLIRARENKRLKEWYARNRPVENRFGYT